MKYQTFSDGSSDLHYLELGEKGGVPILFYHGFPGAASQALIFQPYLQTHKLHVLSIERPGYGLSTPMASPDYAGLLRRNLELMDLHGIGKFHVVGLSGGGPYARAMAQFAPDRVLSCVLIAGLGVLDERGIQGMRPFERRMLRFFKRAPRPAMRGMLKFLVSILKPKTLIKHLLATSPPADRILLEDAQVQALLLESFRHGLSQGPAGLEFDIQNYLHQTLESFACPLWLYHGDEDTIVPIAMAHDLCRRISGAKLVTLEGEGHYSTAIKSALPIAERLSDFN